MYNSALFVNSTATPEVYLSRHTLPLHSALPLFGRQLHVAADQSLGVDQAPVAEARAEPKAGGVLDERLLVDRAKQATALEIGRHHRYDVCAELGLFRHLPIEVGQLDRPRLDESLGDIDVAISPRGAGGGKEQKRG